MRGAKVASAVGAVLLTLLASSVTWRVVAQEDGEGEREEKPKPAADSGCPETTDAHDWSKWVGGNAEGVQNITCKKIVRSRANQLATWSLNIMRPLPGYGSFCRPGSGTRRARTRGTG